MFFCTDEKKLVEKYKAIWSKTQKLKNSKLNTLLVYDNKYKKTN